MPIRDRRPSRLIFWQYCLTPHQATFFRALAAREDTCVTLVAQESVPAFRKSMGWTDPDYGATELVIAPSGARWRDLARIPDREATHIFSPARAYPLVWSAFRESLAAGNHVGVLSEQFDWMGWKGKLRLLRGRVDALRWREQVAFILAIGHTGERWFRMCGYPEDRIYPFGYFVDFTGETPGPAPTRPAQPEAEFRLLFVGSCTYQKGVDILLHALSGVRAGPWRLAVVGDGPERSNLESLAERLGIGERVDFLGYMPNAAVRSELGRSDLLVLPSRGKEGWGAVVNESLGCGVPVVCSDLCGAADLVRDSDRGAVVEAGSVQALRSELQTRIAAGRLTSEVAERIRAWSRRISGDAVAEYLLDVVEASRGCGERPVAPWFR